MTEPGRMTIREHLEELRVRLIRAMLGLGAGALLAFWKIEWVMDFMRMPLEKALQHYPDAVQMVQGKVYSGFLGSMKVAVFAGAVIASPVILHQIWSFVGAGLFRHERRVVKFYAIPGFFLFMAGVSLSYFYVMPFAMDFLIGWSIEKLGVDSLLEFSQYVSLISWSLFVFGLLFQLPVIMIFLMRVGVVTPATFKRYRRHAIVANFALAMMLTPPDVISQVALAGCMAILYESAIFIGSRVAKPRSEEEEA